VDTSRPSEDHNDFGTKVHGLHAERSDSKQACLVTIVRFVDFISIHEYFIILRIGFYPQERPREGGCHTPRPMVFRVDLTLKHLEKQSAFIVDVLANSTGRTVDTLYATLVHRWGTAFPRCIQLLTCSEVKDEHAAAQCAAHHISSIKQDINLMFTEIYMLEQVSCVRQNWAK